MKQCSCLGKEQQRWERFREIVGRCEIDLSVNDGDRGRSWEVVREMTRRVKEMT